MADRLGGLIGPGTLPDMHTVIIQEHIEAPIEAVFANFSDHRHFFRGGSFRAELLKEGEADPNGLGAVRRIESDSGIFVEEITAFNPPHHYQYRIQTLTTTIGFEAPLRHALGQLSFYAREGGTDVVWISAWSIPIPLIGGLISAVMRPMVASAFSGLVRQARQELEAA